MSYNDSYAEDDIAIYAEGDTDQATKYGDVFVEHYATDLMEVECKATECYVACSCNTSNGWYDSPDDAKEDNPNAQVYWIKSKRHRSVSSARSLGTSSINDATADALTFGTSSLKNQTPIKASTRSSLTFDAPTINITTAAATSEDFLTCYKKVPCDNDAGYYATEDECRQGSHSDYYASCVLDTTTRCYKQTACDTNEGYYPISSHQVVTLSSTYTELTNGSGTQCRTVVGCNEDNGYYASESDVDARYFVSSQTTLLGQTCYYASDCAEGYCKNYGPLYFGSETVGTTQDGTKCIQVEGCNTPDLPSYLNYELRAPSCGLVGGEELKCPIATGCDNSDGYYHSKSEFTCDTGYVEVPTEWGFPCYKCDACPDDYFAVDPYDYRRITFSDDVKTLANGVTKCYKPIGCADDLADTTRCYTVTLSKDTEWLGDVTCTSSIHEMCDADYHYHYYKENPSGSKVANAISFDTEIILSETCYHASSCKDGYTETETDNDCYTYGQLTCYEKDPELKEIEFYVDTQALKESCLYYLDYTITDTSGSEYNSNTVDGKSATLAIKCGSTTETYTTTVYYDEPSSGHFEYRCSQGNASLESITINGAKYTNNSNMTVTVKGKSYTLPVRLGIRYTDTCMTSGCPDGYYYSASNPARDYISMTFTKHASYPNCYQASCNTFNGWSTKCEGQIFEGTIQTASQNDITVSPAAIVGDFTPFEPNCDSETWNDTICYKNQTTVCPEYYDTMQNCPKAMNYATANPTSGSGTCYRATSCKSGYTSTGAGTSCTDNGITCNAIGDGWPTDIFYNIDCNHLLSTNPGFGETMVECRTQLGFGTTTGQLWVDGDYQPTKNHVYGVSMQTYGTGNSGEYQTEFPNDGAMGVVNGWGLGVGCGGLAGISNPCSRMKPYYVKVDGTIFYYSNNGTEYIDISITNGTTTKTKTLRVNINYTAPYGF